MNHEIDNITILHLIWIAEYGRFRENETEFSRLEFAGGFTQLLIDQVINFFNSEVNIMAQGAAKKSSERKQKTNKKAEINARPKRVWKKRKDPVKAAIVRKVEALAMEKALKEPMKGGIRFIKPTEDKVKAAKVSTKSLIKNPTQKIK